MWSLHLFFVLNWFLYFPPPCKLILQRKIALEKHMSKLFNQLWNLAAAIQTTPKWTKRKLLLFIILYFLASLVLVQLFFWSTVAELGQKYNAQEPQFPTPPPLPSDKNPTRRSRLCHSQLIEGAGNQTIRP